MSKEYNHATDTKLELKDPFYYEDLRFVIEEIRYENVPSDLYERRTKVQRERIESRFQSIHSEQQKQRNEIQETQLSVFELDLFLIVRQINKITGKSFKTEEAIKKCPSELMQKILLELAQKDRDNELLNHLKLIVKDMGLERAFSLGESAEQCVCLNKSDNLWEVYRVERGITFEKSVFEECYDACIEVIHQLATSNQMEKKAKKDFSLVRNLVPNK